MKIEITCDCGEKFEIDPQNVWFEDTTRCSCGRCHGESYNIIFGTCSKCGKDLYTSH